MATPFAYNAPKQFTLFVWPRRRGALAIVVWGGVGADKLKREFTAFAPNKRWLSGYTYIPTREGWPYLAVLMDLFSRIIVGWSMSARRDKMLTLDALKMAIARRGDVNDLYVTPRSRDGIPNGRVSSTVARLSNHLQHEPQGELPG